MEEERGERGRVTGELAESRGQLTETQDRVATLEERVGQLAQFNSDLQTQLELADFLNDQTCTHALHTHTHTHIHTQFREGEGGGREEGERESGAELGNHHNTTERPRDTETEV